MHKLLHSGSTNVRQGIAAAQLRRLQSPLWAAPAPTEQPVFRHLGGSQAEPVFSLSCEQNLPQLCGSRRKDQSEQRRGRNWFDMNWQQDDGYHPGIQHRIRKNVPSDQNPAKADLDEHFANSDR